MPGQAIAEALAAAGGATPVPRREASAPAARFRADDGLEFGIIASDTQPFCDDCNRIRLSADGRLLGCLYESGGLDLRAELATRLARGFAGKRSHHPDVDAERAPFSMAQTGG
jgi:cyclic pyranopterin phosphate synthase